MGVWGEDRITARWQEMPPSRMCGVAVPLRAVTAQGRR